MLFSPHEIIDLLVMTLALGYIFMDMLKDKQNPFLYSFDSQSFKTACIIIAPAVVLHELGHKFSALLLGLQATLHASYVWLLIGAAMKMLNTGFIFFVPGYVLISGIQSPLQSAITAFAGPAVNLILWLVCKISLKMVPSMKISTYRIISASASINGFLFIFNMLPIFNFDGEQVLSGLMSYF